MSKKTIHRFHFSLLLLIYTFSLGATALHIHEHEHHDLQTGCDQEIYFGGTQHQCSHDSHVSSGEEKCLSCDHHVVNEYLLANFNYPVFLKTFRSEFNEYLTIPTLTKSEKPTNKGPPISLSITA